MRRLGGPACGAGQILVGSQKFAQPDKGTHNNEGGVHRFLTKPLSIQLLLQTVDDLIEDLDQALKAATLKASEPATA